MRRWMLSGVVALGLASCTPAPSLTGTVSHAAPVAARHVVLLPVAFAVLNDGGRDNPARRKADSSAARALADSALVSSLRARGYVVDTALDAGGVVVRADGSRGAAVTGAAGVERLQDALRAGSAPERDVLARLRAESGADAILLASGYGTRPSARKRAAWIASDAAVGTAVAGAALGFVAVALLAGAGADGIARTPARHGAVSVLRVVGAVSEVEARGALLAGASAAEPASFHAGARLHVTLVLATLPDGRVAWRAAADGRANALRSADLDRAFAGMLAAAPPPR
jgi:hypothetical protein